MVRCKACRRRKLTDIARTEPALIAEKGLALIHDLYGIEAEIRGRDPASRIAVRQDRSAAILARIFEWLAYHRACASAGSPPDKAIACIVKYRDRPGHYSRCAYRDRKDYRRTHATSPSTRTAKTNSWRSIKLGPITGPPSPR